MNQAMPSYVSLAKRVPWMKVWASALWLVSKGRKLADNLSEAERKELSRIVAASKGKPGNVSKHDRTRLKNIVKKAATGRQ
jgi:hypothetical protein